MLSNVVLYKYTLSLHVLHTSIISLNIVSYLFLLFLILTSLPFSSFILFILSYLPLHRSSSPLPSYFNVPSFILPLPFSHPQYSFLHTLLLFNIFQGPWTIYPQKWWKAEITILPVSPVKIIYFTVYC